METQTTETELENTSQKNSFKTRILNAMHSKYGIVILSFIAFIESAFFPIPPDFFIVPMVAARPHTWKRIALWTSVFSVLGAFLGYYIGYALFESVGQVIVEKYDLVDEMAKIGQTYNDHAFWSLLTAAFTPLPYKLFTIAAGVFKVALLPFTLAAIIGRTARYILVPYLSALGGRTMAGNKYLKRMTRYMWIALLVAVVGYIIYKFI